MPTVSTTSTAFSRRAAVPQRNTAVLFVAVAFALVCVLSVAGWAPYDDEITNFHMVEGQSLVAIVRHANSVDVHPPGAYVLNAILYDLLGSWESVKIASGCLNALALALFLWLAYERLPPRPRLMLTFLLASAATLVLWGASVRWYAYFDPIFCVTLAVILFSDMRRSVRTAILAVASVALFYIAYAAFCAVLVLCIAHIGRDVRQWTKRDVLILLAAGALGFVLILPQLIVFLKVHAPNQGSQVGAPLMALAQSAMTLTIGNAVFPVSAAPIIYGLVILVALGFYSRAPRSQLEWLIIIVLTTGLVAMSLSGLGVKPRNSAYLLPLALLAVSYAIASMPQPLYIAAAIVVIAFQALSVRNVMAHEDTSKGSYNTDFVAALRQIQSWRALNGSLVVFSHDPVMTYMLDKAAIPQSSPYELTARPTVQIRRGGFFAVVHTYRGVIPTSATTRMYAMTQLDGIHRLAMQDIGPDRYAGIKGRVLKDTLPPFYIHMELFETNRDVLLPDWSRFATQEGKARGVDQ
jgi:hypothetical protein